MTEIIKNFGLGFLGLFWPKLLGLLNGFGQKILVSLVVLILGRLEFRLWRILLRTYLGGLVTLRNGNLIGTQHRELLTETLCLIQMTPRRPIYLKLFIGRTPENQRTSDILGHRGALLPPILLEPFFTSKFLDSKINF